MTKISLEQLYAKEIKEARELYINNYSEDIPAEDADSKYYECLCDEAEKRQRINNKEDYSF